MPDLDDTLEISPLSRCRARRESNRGDGRAGSAAPMERSEPTVGHQRPEGRDRPGWRPTPPYGVSDIAARHEALELPKHETRQAATRCLEFVEEDGQTLPNDLVEQIASRTSVLDGGWHETWQSNSRANGERPDISRPSDGRRRDADGPPPPCSLVCGRFCREWTVPSLVTDVWRSLVTSVRASHTHRCRRPDLLEDRPSTPAALLFTLDGGRKLEQGALGIS